MEKQALKKLIDVAAGRIPADTVIKNVKIVDVYTASIIEGDVAISDTYIAGIGEYEGREIVDGEGKYLAPGFIDSHIHIESSYVSPEELGRLIVPCGGTTIIADPHEIANVAGIEGMNYMLEAAKETALDIKYMLPSCVPATPFENAGAVIDAQAMREPLEHEEILGLGEFMNFPGVINGDDDVLDKLLAAKRAGKIIDGHSPSVVGKDLNAYAAARINDDHECSTLEEMRDRLARGMYILMRQGTVCQDLRALIKGVTKENSRRITLCSDDRMPNTILELGHLDNHLRICVEEGLDPVMAIQMATLNAAECFRLHDRGAIAPGLRADMVLLDDLKNFKVSKVWIAGQKVAEDGQYLPETQKCDISAVKGSVHVKDFSRNRLALPLSSDKVYVIDIQPGGVLTKKAVGTVSRNNKGEFLYNPELGIAKVAVIERHNNTGNVAVGLLRGYGIKEGAVALTIAHDSHNIIVVGVSDEEMEFAVQELIKQEGGIVMVNNQKVIANIPLPIAGLMSDQSGEWVDKQFKKIEKTGYEELHVNEEIDPIMTLCFMSLPVIPELKLTDMGLFDVTQFAFIPIEVD